MLILNGVKTKHKIFTKHCPIKNVCAKFTHNTFDTWEETYCKFLEEVTPEDYPKDAHIVKIDCSCHNSISFIIDTK